MAFLLGESLLLERLNDNNMSRAKFAVKMECSRSYVTGLIKGKERMSLEFAINAAHVLNCSVNDLQNLIESKSRKG